MGRDDRMANRQPHSHARFLCRDEGLKQSRLNLIREPRAIVRNARWCAPGSEWPALGRYRAKLPSPPSAIAVEILGVNAAIRAAVLSRVTVSGHALVPTRSAK